MIFLIYFLRVFVLLTVLLSDVRGQLRDSAADPHEFLYLDPTENAPVIEFSLTEKGDFRKSSKPKVVKFYNPFCGACQNYKPTYLKLAKALHEYVDEDELEIYAISCQVHAMVCDEFAIDDIPMVVLFPEGEVHFQTMFKLKPREKQPNYIIPFLFPHVDAIEQYQDGEAGREKDDDAVDDGIQGDDIARVEGRDDGQEPKDDPGQDIQNADPLMQQIFQEMNKQDSPDYGQMDKAKEPPEDEEAPNDDNEQNYENDPPKQPKVNMAHQHNEMEQRYRQVSKELHQDAAFQEQAKIDRANQPDDDDAMAGQRVAVGGNEEGLMPPELRFAGGNAGAGMANAEKGKEMVSDMDRFKDGVLRFKNEAKGVFRKSKAKIDKEQFFDSDTGATNTMKAHMPGTTEYESRQKENQSFLNKLMDKKGLRPSTTTISAGAGGAARIDDLPANHKPVLPYQKGIQEPKLSERIAGKVPLIKRMVKMSHEEELILDASLSFMTVLKHGVFLESTDPLSKSKKKALQDWFDLLRVSLPPEWSLHEVIMDLDNNIDAISMNSHNLHKFVKKHELPRKHWSKSCAPSKDSNGFNCGFWKLLHVLTVGVAEHRGGTNLVEANLVSHEARVFSPMEAADTIKRFIENFFLCPTCRNHFVAQYNECSNRRCIRLTDSIDEATNPDFQELAKWLWEVHNDVNVRLFLENNSNAAAHEQVKALFPSIEACFSCFKDDGTFDEDHIFLYLEKHYWPGVQLDSTTDRLLQFHDAEPKEFAIAWAVLFVAVGLIYLLRPKKAVTYRIRKKKRIE